MERALTCIVCPIGCQLKAELDDNGKFLSVSGNTCPRGAEYARNECTNPMRMVTSTVRCEDGSVTPVKTDRPIPKDKIFDCMEIINKAVISLQKSSGDIIIKDVFGSNIIITGGSNI